MAQGRWLPRWKMVCKLQKIPKCPPARTSIREPRTANRELAGQNSWKLCNYMPGLRRRTKSEVPCGSLRPNTAYVPEIVAMMPGTERLRLELPLHDRSSTCPSQGIFQPSEGGVCALESQCDQTCKWQLASWGLPGISARMAVVDTDTSACSPDEKSLTVRLRRTCKTYTHGTAMPILTFKAFFEGPRRKHQTALGTAMELLLHLAVPVSQIHTPSTGPCPCLLHPYIFRRS